MLTTTDRRGLSDSVTPPRICVSKLCTLYRKNSSEITPYFFLRRTKILRRKAFVNKESPTKIIIQASYPPPTTMTDAQACSLPFFDTIIEKAETIAQATFQAVMNVELCDQNLSAHKLEPTKLKYLGKRMPEHQLQPEEEQEKKKHRLYRICLLPTFETQNKLFKEQKFETCSDDCTAQGHMHITSDVAEKIINKM